MTSPLHAAYYADQAVSSPAEIIENVRLAKRHLSRPLPRRRKSPAASSPASSSCSAWPA